MIKKNDKNYEIIFLVTKNNQKIFVSYSSLSMQQLCLLKIEKEYFFLNLQDCNTILLTRDFDINFRHHRKSKI